MLENSPTMGSIEMTDYERRQLAAQSLESNIRDEHFCELFSDLAMKIRNEIEKRNSARANEVPSTNTDRSLPENNILNSVVYNSVVLVGFGLFIYLVKYVLYNMNFE